MNDARINWQRLVLLVAIRLIRSLHQFAATGRDQAFVIDESLFKREFSKKTELLSKVFDHDHERYYTGFRASTLGWSNGNTFLPLNFALMASSKKKNQIGPQKPCDSRSLAAKRRQQAHRKMNLVALELVDHAIKAGVKARYALFDSWFAYPKMFHKLLKRGINGIGMTKQTEKVYFRYRGREMDVKRLYATLKQSKRPTHQHYLYSPIVQYDMGGTTMAMKLVFVTKKVPRAAFWF
ncbi:transposase [Lacticaseibacillus rhamnosus]|uniref:IS4 family transposase n=1 Tax=Lacticaseibacillus rhamnosus TaxID=47715 RepID=UPI000B0EB497|nr:transposase [Lacticaseibacillus rhamnosus]MBS4972060.1 transposase [Lacticaseibacillus rhamnosus]MDK7241200.1 transposase [Lacticaseibacillus rhamnosus]MDT8865155.1 transposase [Lacticaseibacillus rhamnosus]